jgi:tetratricopeptide (TPR) repeat protein
MTIAEAIQGILHEEGQTVLRDARRFRALIQDRCFDAHKGELHVTCVLLSENHVARLRGNCVSATEKLRIQTVLHENFGFDREIVSRAIANWSALLCLGGAVRVDPQCTPEDVAKSAISLNASGHHKDAEDLIREAISLHCSSAHLYASLAEILNSQGRLRDALAAIKRARELEPSNVEYVVAEGTLSLRHREIRNKQIL